MERDATGVMGGREGGPLSPCVCSTLRMVSRAVTQLYDDILRPSGLRVTQFSILAAIARRGEANLRQLERALAIAPNADAWEALGDVFVGEAHPELAQRCYRNALALARGEATEALPESRNHRIDTRVTAVEERDQHGVPRLSP